MVTELFSYILIAIFYFKNTNSSARLYKWYIDNRQKDVKSHLDKPNVLILPVWYKQHLLPYVSYHSITTDYQKRVYDDINVCSITSINWDLTKSQRTAIALPWIPPLRSLSWSQQGKYTSTFGLLDTYLYLCYLCIVKVLKASSNVLWCFAQLPSVARGEEPSPRCQYLL